MTNDKLFHFNDNGVHYYSLKGQSNVVHPDSDIESLPARGWYLSDKELDTDKFMWWTIRKEHTGYVLRNNLPSYVNRDALPDTLQRRTSDADYELYERTYDEWVEVYGVNDEWIHVNNAPCPDVEFKWLSRFPHSVREYPELLHLFPCRVDWKSTVKWYLEDYLKAKYSNVARDVYVFKDYLSIDFDNVSHVRVNYPLLEADTLESLNDAFTSWLNGVVKRVDRQVLYNEKGSYNGSFYDPFDGDEFERRFKEVTRTVVWNSKKNNEAETRTAMNNLRDYVWKQIQAAALWESGVVAPENSDN